MISRPARGRGASVEPRRIRAVSHVHRGGDVSRRLWSPLAPGGDERDPGVARAISRTRPRAL